MKFDGKVFNGQGEYLDRVSGRIVQALRICVRYPTKEESMESGMGEYVIEEGSSKRFCHSEMELLAAFSNQIEDVSVPINIGFGIDYHQNKYPYDDPRYGIESIVNGHNKMACRFHTAITEDAGNPFTYRAGDCITKERAFEIIEEMER